MAKKSKKHRPTIDKASEPQPGTPIAWRRDAVFALILLAAVALTYQPAWHGGLIWDDSAHITAPELRSLSGLARIWCDVRATLQYYPLLHSAFWVEHRLWGDNPLGYHLVNIVLHTSAALLVALVLRRLAIPGAYLAAAIFALHPVQVETVAWITELKNILSTNFYLAALLAYLRFDETRRPRWYLAATGLFIAALLSKTVTGTLPAAILVIVWWQRGRLSLLRDVVPLAPWFALGAAGGMTTAWWELEMNKCRGAEFDFTLVERLLIAGRAVWFQLGKLFLPINLTFSYPRWQIDPRAAGQYIYPLGLLALLAVLWMPRRKSRAPLAAMLLYCGTLVPVLGFLNLYTFKYSFVADHYQYLACLALIALVSGAAVSFVERRGERMKALGRGAAIGLLCLLALLSWRQSRMYTNLETLYETTIERNPEAWLAYNNLILALNEQGRFDESETWCRKALDLMPDRAEAHYDLGVIEASRRRNTEALAAFRKALELQPDYADAQNNVAWFLATSPQESIRNGREAVELAQRAVRLTGGRNPSMHDTLAAAYAEAGRFPEALKTVQQALDLAVAQKNARLAASLRARQELYRAGKPFREGP